MRISILAVAVLVASGCDEDKECREVQARKYDATRGCLIEQWMQAEGLRQCRSPKFPPTAGLIPTCIVNSSGEVFFTLVVGQTWLEGTGWTVIDSSQPLSDAGLPRCPSNLTPVCS
jgi:hypothetical protein